jgi:hypothetical protein
MKIRPMGAVLFHADKERDGLKPDGQTDMTKVTVGFRSYDNEPKSV